MTTSEHSGDGEGGRNALVAEYVLGLLDAAEHARVERLIEADPACAPNAISGPLALPRSMADFEDVPRPRPTCAAHRGARLWRRAAAAGCASGTA